MPENYNFQPNSTVFTSGKDGIFLTGISVGKVIEEKEDNSIVVQLFSDPTQILLVNVVLGKSSDTEEM